MKLLLIFVILVAFLARGEPCDAATVHTSYRVAVEKLIFTECGIEVDIVQTEKFRSGDGVVAGEVTTVKCPNGRTPVNVTINFTSPTTRERGEPLRQGELRYELEFIGGVFQRLRACDLDDLCSVWVDETD